MRSTSSNWAGESAAATACRDRTSPVGDRRPRGALGGLPARPGSPVLRNKVGATTSDELRAAEIDLLEFRLTELRSQPRLVSRTYDLTHLQHLHFQLFQDIYEWAGDLRTVGIAKGDGDDTSFIPPLEIERPVAHVETRFARATGGLSASSSPNCWQSRATLSTGARSTWTASTPRAMSRARTVTPRSSGR